MRCTMVGLLCCFAAIPGAAAAQQRDTSRADSTSRVRRALGLSPVVITNSRVTGVDPLTPAKVDDIRVTTVPAGPAAAAETLRHLPGVSMFDDQGSRLQPELDVRGFIVSPVVGQPQGVSVFLDGVRINEPDAQEVNFDLIPMDAIDHAELVRGPNTLFGKNSLAGSLLLFTGRGESGSNVSAAVDGGPYGYRSAGVKAGGMLGDVDGLLTGRFSDEQSWRQSAGARTRMLFGNAGRKRDSSDVALTVMYANDKLFEAGALPESYLNVDRRINYTPGDFFHPELLHVALRGQAYVAGGEISGNLFWRRNAYEQYNGNVPPPNSDGFVRNRSGGGLAEWTRLVDVGSVATTATIGAEYSHSDVRYRFLAVVQPGAPASPADLAQLGCDPSTAVCTDVDTREDDAALYAQTALAFTPTLSLTAAVRGDYVNLPIMDRRTPANSGANSYWRPSPKLGLSYRPRENLHAYAAVNAGFRAPAALEIACADAAAPCSLPFALGADPPLKPVRVLDYEAGIDGQPIPRVTIGVATFLSDVHDDILFVQPTLTTGFFQNVARTRRAGADASASVDLTSGARAFGSYSYVAATYRTPVQIASALPDEPATRPGDHFPDSPDQRGSVGVDVTRTLGHAAFEGAVEVHGVSRQFLRGDEANIRPALPGYALTELRLTGHFARGSVRADVTNLFNRQYVNFGVYAQNVRGPLGGSALASPDDAPVERFLTPGQPRVFSVSVTIGRE
jgi:iron complex outermembrane recepter protein